MKTNGKNATLKSYAIAGIVAIALISAMMVMPASATTVTISPSDADSWISQYDIDSNFGTRSDMWVRSYAGSNYRGLVRFDLSPLPAGETIESAELWLMKGVVNALTERTHNAHRVTGNWIETEVTWNNQPSYDSTATDSVTITPGGSEIWLEWDVTSDVQLFADGTQNYGWLIKDAVEDIDFPPRGWFYHSREKGDSSRCPKLVVTYMEEEPTPPKPFVIYGEVNYDTGEPVPNPTVTVEKTGESFDVSISGNKYQVSTDSSHVSAGDVLHFNASNDNVTEFDHPVTEEEMAAGGFVQDIIIIHSGALTPDLILTDINAYHNNTRCPAWFNLSNEIDVTVKNDGDAAAGASNVSLYIEGDYGDTAMYYFGKLPVPGLGAGNSSTVTFTDWVPVGDDCLQPPCNYADSYKDYNFTAVADCDGVVIEGNETNNATTMQDRTCYNGYMGDDPLENVAHGVLHGGVLFTTGDGSYGGLYSVDDSRSTNYNITIPEGASVEFAHLKVFYTWHYEKTSCPQMAVSITNATGTYDLPLEKAYNDLKCTCPGAAWVFPWGNYVYDLTDYIHDGGVFTVTVTRTGGPSFCVAAPGVDLVYEDENAPLIEYWINEGADVLMGGRRYPTSSNLAWWECISNATFQASTETGEVVNATIGVVAPWGDSTPDDILFFNDVELGRGVYNGYSSPYSITIDSLTMEIGAGNAQVGINATDVITQYLQGSDNMVGQADDGDNIMACNAFLVVEYETEEEPDLVVSSIEPNCGGYLFGNESNELCAEIDNIGGVDATAFNVSFVVDGFNEEVRIGGLAAGTSIEVCVNDPTLRNAGDAVTITVTADCNAEIVESNETNNASTLATTVVNNGYKGKRYTGGEDLETIQTHTLNGNLLYSLGDSYYLSAYSYPDWTTYNASWTASDLPVPGTATVEEARLYVIYTWDKKNVMPDNVSMAFNGITQTLEKLYTDRKMFGSYDYPYGMMAYDVTDDFNTGGNIANLTNSYPSGGNVSMRGMALVVVYADSSEPSRIIYMNEGFDQIVGMSSKCTTPEEATAYAPFGAIGLSRVENATLITFAPGASPDEGELLFNGQTWYDVWNFVGTGSPTPQIGIDERDVTAYLQSTGNEAGFQSSGDYMEASNAFLVVELIPEIPVDIDVKPGSCPNQLNLKSTGVLPVAVLGTAKFDVTTIDPGTILLNRSCEGCVGVAPIRWSYEDVATPFAGELCDCHDLNGDGYMDLTLKFDTQELVSSLKLDKVAGETIPLALTGNLKGGTPIEGKDCIRVQ